MLRCLSGPNRPCKDSIIRVAVVDQCTDPCPASFLLSTAAFTAVSRFNDAKINVEFAHSTPSLLRGMEPGVAAQEARWSSFGSEDSDVMVQLLGPFSCTNEQAEKDLSFGLSSMSWSSDHAADSYDSSSEIVSSFFGHCSGYESYYLSEPNAAPVINTSSASAYCMVGDQLITPSLRLIPYPSFGDPATGYEETSSDDAGDSSFILSEPVLRMTLPKRKLNTSEDDSPSDVSKKKARAGANVSVAPIQIVQPLVHLFLITTNHSGPQERKEGTVKETTEDNQEQR
ncbi:hypothetical protein BHM03_00011256 [Ensete ventricosum]|nr:hypothetical protein BHM03_00011256 [Ensete ventricosum]